MAKQRELSSQVRNLLDVLEKSGLAGARSVQERFASRQEELERLNQMIAHKRRELDQALAKYLPSADGSVCDITGQGGRWPERGSH